MKFQVNLIVSYKLAPTKPKQFAGEQIILNSGRLLFNTKSDSILMSSKNSINLNAVNDVNIDAPRTVIQSKTVKLGDRDAFESVILGDKFFADLSRLLKNLIELGMALPSVGNPSVAAASTTMMKAATQILNNIEKYKSKTTKIK